MALFTQCGNALQTHRQKREYKDLMCFVQDKSLQDYDPANTDPLLLARLEENKRVAKIKENEILDRFVHLEKINKLKRTAASYYRRAPADSDPGGEILRQVGSAVTQQITSYMMPIISETCSLYQNNTNLNQPSNIVTQSCPNNPTPPLFNQSNVNPGLYPNLSYNNTLVNPTSNDVSPPLIHTIQSLNGALRFPIMTIAPSAENNPSQFNNETINNNQKIADNVATTYEVDNSSTQTSIIKREPTHDILEQNNSNDNMGTKEVVENINTEIQVKEENEMHDSNANSLTNVNIINDRNVVDKDNRINKDLITTKENYSTIASTPETLIKKEPEDTPCCNMFKENHETQTNLESDVDTLNTNSNPLTKIRVRSIGDIQNNTHNTIEENNKEINESEQNIENVTVKKEIITKRSHEIQMMLDGLGDSYISTIFDIEDPFLVVEISSDSSDDDL